jgi:DNA (cytosine-5)-methyltransferase 1
VRPLIGSVCSGYEGLGLAVMAVLGGELAWLADNDPGASAILAHRFPSLPNLGDISAADWSAVEPVDVLTAGFPCQDVSCAGGRAGLREGNRTGVWAYVARVVDALRPPLVVLENVRGLLSAGADSDVESCPWCVGEAGSEHSLRALGAVLGDLADLGYDARWATVSAADAGAPHRRERVFITAWPAADAECDGQPGRPAGSAGEADEPRSRSRAEAAGRGPIAADAERLECQRRGVSRVLGSATAVEPGEGLQRQWSGNPAGHSGTATPAYSDSTAGRRHEPWSGSSPLQGTAVAEWTAQQPGRLHSSSRDQGAMAWGSYELAIRRWERVLGRPAPAPTESGRTGQRLSPRFVEWMQGLPDGWVTDVPGLSRNAQLKALGNGVVPQQAAMALRMLLDSADIAG